MYRTKDFTYLPDYTKDFKNAEELFLFLAQKFDIDAESVDSRQYLRMSILMLAYICQYITNEELSFYFGSYYSSSAIRRALARLVDENMLRSEHFKPKDSASTRAYCLSKKSIEAAGSLFPLECRNMLTVRKSNGVVPSHDYSAGINMLQLICSPLSFSWRKEFVFPGYRKVARSVRVDYVISLRGNYPKQIYIEQDMGTETIGRLVEKIACYSDHNITNDENACMVFSFRTIVQQATGKNPLSNMFCQKLLKDMESSGEKSLYSFWSSYESSDKEICEAINKFLVLTGVCEAPVSYSNIRHDTELTRIGNHDFTLADLQQYCSDLEENRNPYRTISMNKTQIMAAFRKEMSIFNVLMKYVQQGMCDIDEIRVLLGGFQVFAVPTDLLGNHLKYFVPSAFEQLNRYNRLLSSYYQLKKDSYHSSLPPFIVSNRYPSIVLRNAFLCEDGGVVCVESANDLSALVRALFLNRLLMPDNLPYTYIHFVFAVDNDVQAYEIASHLNCFSSNTYLIAEDIAIYFVLRSEIGKKESISSIIRYDKGDEKADFELYHMLPASKKAENTVKSDMSYADVVASLFGNV